MAFTAALLQVGSGIFKASSQVQEGNIRAGEQESAAEADLFNADLARSEARLTQAKAKIEIGRKRKAQKSILSEQQVQFAISGVRIDEGTPLVVAQNTIEETELDILITEFNADVQSQRLESQARQDVRRAGQRRSVASQERVAGKIRAGKTLLGSFSTFAQKFPTETKKEGEG